MAFVFHLAMNARVVVFNNDLDGAATFAALILPPIYWGLFSEGKLANPSLQAIVFLGVAIAATIYTISSCFRWNGSFWGCVVFPAKVLFCLLFIIDILVIHMLLSEKRDSAGNRHGPSLGDAITAFSIAAIAFATMKTLTNGDRVRAQRGGPTGGASAGSSGNEEQSGEHSSERERFRSGGTSSNARPETETTAESDPLKVLNIEEGYSESELKERYHELLRRYHPDKFHTLGEDFANVANERVKEINKAYDELRSRL
jgi:hypothetical protein